MEYVSIIDGINPPKKEPNPPESPVPDSGTHTILQQIVGSHFNCSYLLLQSVKQIDNQAESLHARFYSDMH